MNQPHNHEPPTSQLLNELLSQPTLAHPLRLEPVVLYSLEAQRQHTLHGYLLRNWFDRALKRVEYGLGIVVLMFFGWWFATSYGYDLVHAWRARNAPAPAIAWAAPAPVLPTDAPQQVLLPSEDAVAGSVNPSRVLGNAPPAPMQPPSQQAKGVQPLTPDAELGRDPAARYGHAPFVPNRNSVPAEPTIAPPTPTTLPPTPMPEPDRRPQRIMVPVIELDEKVVEVFIVDDAWQVAEYAAGYMHGTGVAGQGNMALAGHKGTRGSVFRNLEKLHTGHDIWIDTADTRFHYQVEHTWRVWPTQTEVIEPTTGLPTITLMTCTNWDTQRFIVRAALVGTEPLHKQN